MFDKVWSWAKKDKLLACVVVGIVLLFAFLPIKRALDRAGFPIWKGTIVWQESHGWFDVYLRSAFDEKKPFHYVSARNDFFTDAEFKPKSDDVELEVVRTESRYQVEVKVAKGETSMWVPVRFPRSIKWNWTTTLVLAPPRLPGEEEYHYSRPDE